MRMQKVTGRLMKNYDGKNSSSFITSTIKQSDVVFFTTHVHAIYGE